MNIPTIEQLVSRLSGPYEMGRLQVTYSPETDSGDFNRFIGVKTQQGHELKIEWWVNILYIHFNGALIPCHDMELKNTWPVRSKMNLQAKYHGETCFILPTQLCDKEPKPCN